MRYIISFLLASIAPAYADVPRVVTDLPPVHSLVSQVMGDLGQPQLLLERGANAHDFQMRPSQAAALQEAELVVWVGPEMTPWLDRALLGLSGARQLQLLADAKTYRQDYGTTHGNHDDEDDPEHIGLDPHAWLDPTNAVVWLDLIAENLATLDPEHAATYIGNAARAKTDLALLDARIAAQLAPERGKWLVVYHDAYGYFSHHYGLTVVAALAEGDAAGPGAQHIAQIEAQEVRQQQRQAGPLQAIPRRTLPENLCPAHGADEAAHGAVGLLAETHAAVRTAVFDDPQAVVGRSE